MPALRHFAATSTRIAWPGGAARCVVGRSGLIAADAKREGDGATPLGTWIMREVFWRPDRLLQPQSALRETAITPDMGWCDDPASPDYNRRVALPFAMSHEKLWREDGLYDLIVPLGWNDDPVIPGRGSAIFLHVAAPAWTPTEGCVATDRESLLALLRAVRPGDGLVVLS